MQSEYPVLGKKRKRVREEVWKKGRKEIITIIIHKSAAV